MKKTIIYMLVVLMCFGVVSSCAGNVGEGNSNPAGTEASSNIGESEGEVYSLSLKDISATGAILCINHNDEISYGRAYTIEVEKDGVWTEVAYVDDTVNAAFPDDKTYLTGNGEKEEVLDWSSIYGSLEEGHYRLVKEIDSEGETMKEYIEFEV